MGGARVSGLTPKNKATISMYAKWNPIEYRINYELNGGSQPVNKKGEITNPKTHLYDKSVSLKNPVRIGYTFGGWFDNPEFAGKKMTSIPVKIAAPITVYAKWTPIKYTINFSANGGKGKMASIKNVEYDSMVMLTPNDFTKNGYTFQGWSLSKNGEVEYRDRSQVSNLRTTNGSVTLYAKWTKD